MQWTAAEQDRSTRAIGRSEYRAEIAEAPLAGMRRRVAQAEQALAECNDVAKETAGELVAARDGLRRTCLARDEAEKIAAGLKQHIALLMADAKDWHAAFAAAQQARLADTAETDRTIAGLAREIKQVLSALDNSRLDLAARLGEAESGHATRAAKLETRLNWQADEIERLMQAVENEGRVANPALAPAPAPPEAMAPAAPAPQEANNGQLE